MVRRIVLASLAGIIACACQPSQSGTEDSSTSVADVPADLPVWEECEDASGELKDLPYEWEIVGRTGHDFAELYADAGGVYIAEVPVLSEQPETPEFRLHELELESGDIVASVDIPMYRGVGTFARHPEGDLLHFSVDGHQMIARRYSHLELVDETYLEDDNPRVGYDGGESAIGLVDARLDDFTLLGVSYGLEDPESSGDVERRWRKQYGYSTPQPIQVDSTYLRRAILRSSDRWRGTMRTPSSQPLARSTVLTPAVTWCPHVA